MLDYRPAGEVNHQLMYEVNRNLFYDVGIVIQGQPLDPREVILLSFWRGLIGTIAKEFKNLEEGISKVTSTLIIRGLG